MAPVSQIRAGALPATAAKELALVAALWQSLDHAGARGPGVGPILLEDERELLADEFRSRDPPLPGRPGEEAVIGGVEGDGGRFLSSECHGSNITMACAKCDISRGWVRGRWHGVKIACRGGMSV